MLLVALVLVGALSVFGYMFVHYDNTSVTTGYSAQEVIDHNKQMHEILLDESDECDDLTVVTVIDYAAKPFLQNTVTYTVSVYQVKDGVTVDDTFWSLKKTPASKHPDLTKIAEATIVVDEKADQVLQFKLKSTKD